MERMQCILVVALVLSVIAIPSVLSAYSLEVDVVEDTILRHERAVYRISISNFEEHDARFQVSTNDPTWVLYTDPNRLDIPTGETRTLTLYVDPTEDAFFGTHGVDLKFKDLADGGGIINKKLVLTITSGDVIRKQYEPAVSFDLKLPYELDPRQPIPLRIEVRNRNWLNMTGIEIYVDSPHFGTQDSLDLPPLSEKTKDIAGLSVDPLTPPEEAEVRVRLILDGETIAQLTKNYKIQEYTTVKQNTEESGFFFKTTKAITVTNDGNIENTAIVTIPTSLVKALFVSSDLAYDHVKTDDRMLVWTIPLSSNETKEFVYVENYRIIILLLVLFIVGGISYFVFRSPVIVVKEAVGVTKKDDGVSLIKVRIFIKNRSARMVRDIQVTDKVPSLVDVIPQETPGSMAPSKIAVSKKSGTLLKWNLDILEPYEERVLTYRSKSKLKIIGRVSLPQSKVRFSFRDKERAVFSNNIEIVERFRDR
ncbi:DUF4139 domain-containing protein [Candidatus Woesearchaeota archaeon]|nr:DUF4139 domain-containing protein [Candidatus Woesearchaeota archaeon]